MSTMEIIALIAAAAALTAAAGALWAARAAQRSAAAAQETARHAERVDRRGILRDLIATCHRLVAESVQIGSIAEELKTEYRLLAAASGQSGGASEKRHILQTDSKQKEILALQEEAQQAIRERARMLDGAEDEFMQALSKFDGYLVRALRTKSSLEREFAAVAGNNRLGREGRIRTFNQRPHKPEGM